MKKLSLALMVSLVLLGCAGTAKETIQTNNSDYQVDYLFEKDGCKVYRFTDAGHYRYYVVCAMTYKNQVNMQWDESCGKNCSVEQNISTVNK